MKIEYEINIDPMDGEVFKFLDPDSVKSNTIMPHRFYISNKGRIIDLAKERLLNVTNGRVNIVASNGHRMNVSMDVLLRGNFPDEYSKPKRRKFIPLTEEQISKIREMYIRYDIGVPEIAIKFGISEYRVRCYLGDKYDKIRSACIAKHGNYELSIAYMEALNNISQTTFKESSIYSVLKSIAEDELGIKFDKNLYHKAYAYITGRSSFLVVTEESSTTSPKGRRSKQTEMESPSDKEGEDIV